MLRNDRSHPSNADASMPPTRLLVRMASAAGAAATLVACGAGELPAPPSFERAVVFGASLSDTGNFCSLNPTNCTSAPYAAPRYSNGPVFAELIADQLGTTVAPSRAGGTNYAYAGARTGAVAGTTQAVPNMTQQVEQYLATVGYQASPQYLYIVDAVTAGNDILDGVNLAGGNPNATVLNNAVTNVAMTVQRLYAAGARHIVVANSADVGRTPRAQALSATAVNSASQMSVQFNAALAEHIGVMRSTLPEIRIVEVDIASLAYEVMASPASFGYSNATQPCFNDLLLTPTLCTAAAGYFYWDSFNPSASAHQLVAERALAALGR